MKIDKKLNLVVAIEQDNGQELFIHSTPIQMEVFQRYALLLASVYSKMTSENLNILSSIRIASMVIRETALQKGDEYANDVEQGLMNEIKRLTNAIVLKDGRWQQLPIDVALKQGYISEEDFSEAENIISFFTVISLISPKKMRAPMLNLVEKSGSGLVTSLDCMEYQASLPISTEIVTSGEIIPASSVPC